MSYDATAARDLADTAPGDQIERESVSVGVRGYMLGYALAVVLTVASYAMVHSSYVWLPARPMALVVFAIAQMGVHLVFFLHITTGPDSINNVMALALGTLIVFLLVGGSIWIMSHVDANMVHMPMSSGA